MTDRYAENQQRAYNLSTFSQMGNLWFPQRKPRGATYRFTQRQLDIAKGVIERRKESK